jgi:hypothetical protein
LDLALEVLQINLKLLEKINPYKGQEDLLSDSLDLTHKAITAIKQARSAPVQEKWGASAVMNPDYMAAQKQKAQQALDVMAENARELGLDYEPVQEPVGTYGEIYESMQSLLRSGLQRDQQIYMAMKDKPLYATPPAAPVQEPLAWKPEDYGYPKTYEPPAAQRQWVGLTDDERVDLWKATETDNRMVLIDAIEAKLKEKNGV